MKEFANIIKEYHRCKASQRKVALATVVKVDGSAYRRPGARMLVTEEGGLTGAISGGCLEGDALRKGQTVIFQQQSKIVTYDTTDEDDQKFGIGLGCNGIIQVLIEPIDYEDPFNPIMALQRATLERNVSWIVTVFSLENQSSAQIGTMGVFQDLEYIGRANAISQSFFDQIRDKVNLSKENQALATQNILGENELYAFLEPVIPTVHILLFGAGNDTIAVAEMAGLMGWQVTLLDGRKNHATQARFPSVQDIVVGPADQVLENLSLDKFTVALLMTHNFEYEAVVLEKLQKIRIPYIGVLGPKKKTQKLIERLEGKGVHVAQDNLYAPLGLDIGAEGSEEIALSVLSEIRTVLNRKKPIHLREKDGPIHG